MRNPVRNMILVAAALLSFVNVAYAATSQSTSYTYFDESGAVVGQQILLCTNIGYHGGNIHTAYKIEQAIACDPGSNSPIRPIVANTQVVYYVLPSTESISAACGLAQCLAAGEQLQRLTSAQWTWIDGVND